MQWCYILFSCLQPSPIPTCLIFPPHSDSPHLTPPPLPSPRHHIDLTEYSVNVNLYAQLHIYSYPIQDITLIRLNVNLKKTSFSGFIQTGQSYQWGKCYS